MYNTDFDMKRARYVVVLKRNYYRYRNGINTWNNQEYMESMYGVYAYSFDDILIFLEKELVTYFSQNNLIGKEIKDRKNELYQYYKDFKIYDLENGIYIGEEYHNRKHYIDQFSDLRDFKLFNYNHVSESTLIYISKSYELITRVAEWNGTPYKLSYLYPILKIDKEYSRYGKRQYRKRFHTRSRSYLLETKREVISGADPETKQYLSMRQRNRNHCLNYSGLRNNRNNVPGDWKHYNKCRKQWAKNIDNPSYEKLSRAVWKQELEEIEADVNYTLNLRFIETEKDRVAIPIFSGWFLHSRFYLDICNYQVCYYHARNSEDFWVTFGYCTMKLRKNPYTNYTKKKQAKVP